MIEVAAEKGAWAIKFQLFKAEELSKEWADFENNYVYYRKHMICSYQQLHNIFTMCKKCNILPAFTIFTPGVISPLEDVAIQCSMYPIIKIASPDLMNYKLIEQVLYTFNKSEIFISTGMHAEQNILFAMEKLKHIREDIKFMYCISKYPTLEKDINFSAMVDFDGFSDHTEGIEIAKRAIDIIGIEYIEKHFTLSRNLPGKDQFLSIEPDELKELTGHVQYVRNCMNYKKRWVYE
jgi:N,N'-diacetyllegionaminate synthase